MSAPVHLFVYGTLMSGYDHPMARWLAERADSQGEAVCQARLYRVKHYPGLVLSADPADRVFGELFRLREVESVLAKLDEYEGCGPGAAEPTQYIRTVQAVVLPDQSTVEAWIYLFNHPLAGLSRIVSGRFLAL